VSVDSNGERRGRVTALQPGGATRALTQTIDRIHTGARIAREHATTFTSNSSSVDIVAGVLECCLRGWMIEIPVGSSEIAHVPQTERVEQERYKSECLAVHFRSFRKQASSCQQSCATWLRQQAAFTLSLTHLSCCNIIIFIHVCTAMQHPSVHYTKATRKWNGVLADTPNTRAVCSSGNTVALSQRQT
jgi:hypothetical protein